MAFEDIRILQHGDGVEQRVPGSQRPQRGPNGPNGAMDSGWALWQIAPRVQGWLLMGTSSIKIGYQYINKIIN